MATVPRRRKPGALPKAKNGKISRFARIGRKKVDAEGNPVKK